MTLTLEITGPDAAKLGAARRKVFQAAGGTIGRLPDNSWVLQDPYVSSRHASIKYMDGSFYIEDTSTNGVFINSPDNRLGRGQTHALRSGDRIFIEPYEIRASITGASTDAPAASGTAAADDPFASLGFAPQPPAGPSRPGGRPEAIPGEDVDPLNLLGFDAKPTPSGRTAAELARNSVLSEHYEAPAARPPAKPAGPDHGGLIPDDYDPLAPPSGQRPRPSFAARPSKAGPKSAAAKGPAPAAAPGGGGAGGLGDVLAGAGLGDVPITPELARSFGQILRVVVSGVMDVLQARQRIKDEFHMRMTSFKRADNNPLKFSANLDDALHNLLVKRNAAYLGPVEAFEDAFDDIRHHQMAMLAGLRVAFDAMLAEFDPDRLQEEFDRQSKKGGSLLSVPAKMRYWDLYRDRVHDMVRDADASFRELFGDEFARAYEDQLERLKSQGRPGKRQQKRESEP